MTAKTFAIAERIAFKGMMLDGLPNLAFALGYPNACWTLQVDLVPGYVGRLLHSMRQNGYAVATPRPPSAAMETSALIDMTSGYCQRSRDALPLQR